MSYLGKPGLIRRLSLPGFLATDRHGLKTDERSGGQDKTMIASITRFQLPPGIPTETIKIGFREVAPKFKHPPGLLRKYFLISEDGKSGGGVYLWNSMEEARTFSEGMLRPMIRDKFKVEPSIEYYDAPVIVDNITAEIITDEGEPKAA
jgi:hypothetical protein